MNKTIVISRKNPWVINFDRNNGIKGGYFGDVKVVGTSGNVHQYAYHKPNYKTGQTEANGARDNGNRIPGSVAYRTILTAMGAPVDMYKKFPDVGEGETLSCMLKG